MSKFSRAADEILKLNAKYFLELEDIQDRLTAAITAWMNEEAKAFLAPGEADPGDDHGCHRCGGYRQNVNEPICADCYEIVSKEAEHE